MVNWRLGHRRVRCQANRGLGPTGPPDFPPQRFAMNQLYILRHGLAVPYGTPDIADDDRPLTPAGERRVRSVGRALKRLKVKVDRIATSPLPRAHRTAEIVAEVLGKTDLIEVTDELRAQRDAASIQEWLKTRTEERLLIVGHNPSLSDLVGRLVVGPDHPSIGDLRKAGIAALVSDGGDAFKVDWIARPKLFRI